MSRLLSFPIGSASKREYGHVIGLSNMFTTSWLALARGVPRVERMGTSAIQRIGKVGNLKCGGRQKMMDARAASWAYSV